MTHRINLLSWAAAAAALLGMAAIASAADNPALAPGCCADACCTKVCRPTVETKKVTKRVYDDSCEDFCLPKCSLFGCLFGHSSSRGDDCSDCTKCDHHPRTRKYLLIRTRTHDECEHKCVVVNEACCPAPCCPAPCIPQAPAAPAPMAPAPMPKSNQQIMYVPGAPLMR